MCRRFNSGSAQFRNRVTPPASATGQGMKLFGPQFKASSLDRAPAWAFASRAAKHDGHASAKNINRCYRTSKSLKKLTPNYPYHPDCCGLSSFVFNAPNQNFFPLRDF
jgi:hypothetical protein